MSDLTKRIEARDRGSIDDQLLAELSRDHDETRRRLDILWNQHMAAERMEAALTKEMLEESPASPTLTEYTCGCKLTVDQKVCPIHTFCSKVAARYAPAAQQPAVPADVMAAADFLLNDDVGSDLDGLTFVNLSIEHGKTLARYVRDSVSPPPAASPPAGEILKQAANQIEWYRSLCQCLERGSLCQNCNDSTDIIDALRSVAPLPPPGEPGVMLSHDDLCRLSRMFNSHAGRHGDGAGWERRVNEWLKDQIAAANPLPTGGST